MCGIAGLFSASPLPSSAPASLARALAAMVHRGPDGEGVFDEPADRLRMGMRRLSIQDPLNGWQPVYSEDRSIAAVFNGEIYNYVELRDELKALGHVMASSSDTEVLVHLYEEEGPAFLERLNGMFAIALWDARERRLLLARDPLGIKPLFVRVTGGGPSLALAFASEITALEELMDPRPRIDPEGVKQLLTLGYPWNPRTLYEGVRGLLPGERLVVGVDGGAEFTRFESRGLSVEPARTPEEAVERVDAAFRAAIRRQLRSDVPLGIFLSGGLDSGLVAAYSHAIDPSPRPAFFLGFAEKSYDEEPLAAATARRCGLELLKTELRAEEIDWEKALRLYDQPNMDFSIVNSWVLSRFARERVKTVLGGDGGDEIFGGYQTYQANLWAERLSPVPRAFWRTVVAAMERSGASYRRMSWDFFLKSFCGGMLAPDRIARHLAWRRLFRHDEIHRMMPWLRGIAPEDPLDGAAKAYGRVMTPGRLHPFLALDQATYLEGDTLTKTDRGTMAASLEARVPLLDLELVAAARALPESLIATSFRTKVILRILADRMLPREVARAPKGGFTAPVQVWLKEGRIRRANELLTRLNLTAAGLNPDPVVSWWEDHRAGRANHGRRLWTVVQLVDWLLRRGYNLRDSIA